jgi:hypothetical protein
MYKYKNINNLKIIASKLIHKYFYNKIYNLAYESYRPINNLTKCYFCNRTDITKLKIHYGNIIRNKDGTIYIDNLHSKCASCIE